MKAYLRRLHTRECEDECMAELVFEATQEAESGFCAECLTVDIFTQADTWDELRANVREAVRAYYFDRPIPESIRLHLVRDEVLAPINLGRGGLYPPRNSRAARV